jgi:hypothetical protein
MSYWHQMYPKRQRSERVEVPNGEARFEALLAKDLKEGDRKFAESLPLWNNATPQHPC